jgi:hypothetical protein
MPVPMQEAPADGGGDWDVNNWRLQLEEAVALQSIFEDDFKWVTMLWGHTVKVCDIQCVHEASQCFMVLFVSETTGIIQKRERACNNGLPTNLQPVPQC